MFRQGLVIASVSTYVTRYDYPAFMSDIIGPVSSFIDSTSVRFSGDDVTPTDITSNHLRSEREEQICPVALGAQLPEQHSWLILRACCFPQLAARAGSFGKGQDRFVLPDLTISASLRPGYVAVF